MEFSKYVIVKIVIIQYGHPKEICHICHGKTDWRKSTNLGKIIEFSKRESTYFGLIEIDDGIRILGNIIICTSIPESRSIS